MTAAQVPGSPRQVEPWSGEWVARTLGIEVISATPAPLRSDTTSAPLGRGVHDLVGLALRRNPKRAHLLVSTVLGKHVPTDPRSVYGAGLQLGGLVRAALDGEPPAVVVGFAETATALGHAVADALDGAVCLHSTRRAVAGVPAWGDFREEHSHAPDHLLLPQDPALLAGPGPLVLVDDELSTGRTALNTIAAVHGLAPRERYLIATLVDVREPDDRRRLAEVAARLGVRIEVVTLAEGRVRLPADVLARGAALVADLDAGRNATAGAAANAVGAAGPVHRIEVRWPADAVETGRHGFLPTDRARLMRALTPVADAVARRWARGSQRTGRVLVLGTEELMYAPLRLAVALADLLQEAGVAVDFSSSTRSPVLALDDPGYAVRSGVGFAAPQRPHESRMAYNLGAGRYDLAVVVVDAPADTPRLAAPGGLLLAIAGVADATALVVLPDAAAARARRTLATARLTGVR